MLNRPDLDLPLPDADWQRAGEIRPPLRRNSFLAGRKLLRELLAARLGCAPVAVPIIRDCDGKLRLAGGGIEFSLSHCDGWCAVALSADCAVGVDVEPIRPLAGMAEIAGGFFPAAAQAAFAAAAPDEQARVFFAWWTRVEAAVKVAGRGLDDAMTCFDGVVYESCDAVPGLALAVAARSDGPLAVAWHIGRRAVGSPCPRTSG